jgi:hypothetical protein
MALRDLFVISDDNKNEKPKTEDKVVESSTTKFPTNTSTPKEVSADVFKNTTAPVQNFPIGASHEHINKASDIYNQSFDSMNQEGYDFYEFYKGLSEEDKSNPAVYGMAFRMASAMDKTLTKEKLVTQADYYLAEINKKYQHYVTGGNAKKQELITQKSHENETLASELTTLRQQLETIKSQISNNEIKLAAIDSKYAPNLAEVESKILANDIAKNQLINSIETVKQGIINNVK